MRNRIDALLSWGLGTTLALVLGACGVEPLDDGGRPPDDEGVREADGASTQAGPELAPPWDPYADAVAPGTTATVLNPRRALGAPDGQAATVLGLLNSSLVLDLGQGEEGTGDLRVYYRGLNLAVVTQVEFMKADGVVVGSSPLRLVELGVGTHVAVVTYRGSYPYRYVRLRGALLALYQVDAVRTSVRPVCGDGVVDGAEVCDDGNQVSGDGCNSVCRVEPGYTCSGEPSVCADIDECALGTDTCAPDEVCVNTPGGFECEEAPTCAPPRIVCGDVCVDPRTDNNHCGACGNVCAQGQACSSGVCLGTGNLQFTATWSRDGDADLFVVTPANKRIFYGNRGPSAETEFGALDVDDQQGDGPENIFWAPDRVPPSGTYRICLRVGNFNPPPTPATPVSYTVRVRRPSQPDVEFTGVVTQNRSVQMCLSGEPAFVGSIVHP